jgi:uncharacterized protein (DUF2336 family)
MDTKKIDALIRAVLEWMNEDVAGDYDNLDQDERNELRAIVQGHLRPKKPRTRKAATAKQVRALNRLLAE